VSGSIESGCVGCGLIGRGGVGRGCVGCGLIGCGLIGRGGVGCGLIGRGRRRAARKVFAITLDGAARPNFGENFSDQGELPRIFAILRGKVFVQRQLPAMRPRLMILRSG
jgi:hypothetical protein